MSYTSYFYLLFFLGVLVALYYLMPLKKRWLVLLGGSYFFYWLASGKLIVFLLITTVSVYLGALAMEREQQAFDSVRKSLEKEERKARKAVMMRRKQPYCVCHGADQCGASGLFEILSLFQCQYQCAGKPSGAWVFSCRR